jgi:hypothetical protein
VNNETTKTISGENATNQLYEAQPNNLARGIPTKTNGKMSAQIKPNITANILNSLTLLDYTTHPNKSNYTLRIEPSALAKYASNFTSGNST